MYHPHNRPLSTLPAAVLDGSVHLHRSLASWGLPSPAGALGVLGRLGGGEYTVANSLAGLLTQDPLHVDTVAAAIVRAVLDGHVVPGPKEIAQIQQLARWRVSDASDKWRPEATQEPTSTA